ncbi:MAG: MoaA/NifB/PqqE/SkfB family radical SAM enzyme [Myxococcota bacterium]|jgi:MoaA/NifB/PqqE/SkfB family radical SAM enzyme
MTISLEAAGDIAAEDIVVRLAGRQERIHINLGPLCNNNCIFCMEEDRDLRYVVNSSLTPERVRSILEANAGAEEVCFTSGEPTLVEALPEYVSWARDLGYKKRSVMTNGRRLSYMSYCAKLVKAGMNFFYISIHGHTPKLHNALVRTAGTFVQTVGGLDNVTKLRKFGVSLHTSTVITHRNVQYMGEIYQFLRDHGVQQVVFNVMQANGRANTFFDQLFPTYTDIAAQMKRFLDACEEKEPQAFLVDIPLCTTESLPDFNRGYVEKYVHYEVANLDNGSLDSGDKVAQNARRSPDGEFLEITRADLDDAERQKRPECASCKYNSDCEGVWKNYLQRYGWDEFKPVLHGD